MSAEPDMIAEKGDILRAAIRDQQLRAKANAHQKSMERADWLNLWRVYERCVEIAELVWSSRLDGDMKAQQALAEQMRDRPLTVGNGETIRVSYQVGQLGTTDTVIPHDASIPVPLFTPRDRAQFIKEAAATLLISADRKNLSVRFPKEKPDAPEEQETASQPGVEAASGTSEGEMEPETPVSPTASA